MVGRARSARTGEIPLILCSPYVVKGQVWSWRRVPFHNELPVLDTYSPTNVTIQHTKIKHCSTAHISFKKLIRKSKRQECECKDGKK